MLDANGLLGVVDEVVALRERLLSAERARSDVIAATDDSFRRSAVNLVHYVELRCHDIRSLQSRLGLLGLSSLGRAESSVLATLEAVLTALAGLRGEPVPVLTAKVGLSEGHELLARRAERLLGVAPARRSTRIMVTLPNEAADDASFISNLIDGGMDLARINCAHDDTSVWERMIARLEPVAGTGERPCRIAMDLGGPKLRTGPLLPGPRVVRVKPKRDNLGRPVSAGRVRLSAARRHHESVRRAVRAPGRHDAHHAVDRGVVAVGFATAQTHVVAGRVQRLEQASMVEICPVIGSPKTARRAVTELAGSTTRPLVATCSTNRNAFDEMLTGLDL